MTWKASPLLAATPRASRNARALRRAPTEPERRLWRHLRHRLPVPGSHFRRQAALGPYVADFCCLAARLIVEVDGEQHGRDAGSVYDARRTVTLEEHGFRVLRFGNAEVMRDIDAVPDTIVSSLAFSSGASADSAVHPTADPPGGTTPTSNSSPQGGGEVAEP